DLLRIALANLASNAIKYGRRGGEVRVSARLGPRGLRLAVWNEGPGFPPEQRSKLFRRFSRLTTPELKGRKGTGVGLYTVWRIAKLHGGRTGARSEPGQWAEFFVEIPQPAPRAG
ncbi:MAG: ATP-binding protein, partial [Planctomycetes bacterium]|nr:ATP-binding protein [Planctomycetota bacterium]